MMIFEKEDEERGAEEEDEEEGDIGYQAVMGGSKY
jgi:hypothetical protein